MKKIILLISAIALSLCIHSNCFAEQSHFHPYKEDTKSFGHGVKKSTPTPKSTYKPTKKPTYTNPPVKPTKKPIKKPVVKSKKTPVPTSMPTVVPTKIPSVTPMATPESNYNLSIADKGTLTIKIEYTNTAPNVAVYNSDGVDVTSKSSFYANNETEKSIVYEYEANTNLGDWIVLCKEPVNVTFEVEKKVTPTKSPKPTKKPVVSKKTEKKKPTLILATTISSYIVVGSIMVLLKRKIKK